ncbi:MAG: PfkB family carbohydrate kinase [Thermoleophilaceae bacterium]
MRAAVVGHVEWIEFGRVDHVPAPGEIVHVTESWEVPGGGGAVAAVQLCRLAGAATLYTALGDDELGHRSKRELERLGLRVEADFRPEPQRRAFVHVDRAGERTITVIGERLGPVGDDPLPWLELAEVDAVYFTAGDAGAVREARRARTVVATARGLEVLSMAGVQLDALVASSRDRGERYDPGDLDPPPRHVVRTSGAAGGEYESGRGERGRWEASAPPGPVSDFYGCGDSFAAGLTYGLGAGMPIGEAVTIGARCGAACAIGRGPYEGQPRSAG